MRRWLSITAGAVAVLALVGIIGEIAQRNAARPESVPSAPTINLDTGVAAKPSAQGSPLPTTSVPGDLPKTVFTYFFYWYDATTGAHLGENAGLPVHLPADPAPSWRSEDWFARELTDMQEAGIDVVLPVYWGDTEPWSIDGLTTMASAKRRLEATGGKPPDVGLFLDTTILAGKDLTTDDGKAYFYDQMRKFFERIPRDQWALVRERPVIWLYSSFFPRAFDQSTFDYVYQNFELDFGVRPYIVRDVSWDFAVEDDGGRKVDESRPIATEANYKWGAALEGYFERGSVAAVGPGFDERKIPGRGDAYRPREDGLWYYQNFGKAIASGKRLLVIETWNELHEASGVGETVEWGSEYIDYTRRLVDEFRRYESPAASQ